METNPRTLADTAAHRRASELRAVTPMLTPAQSLCRHWHWSQAPSPVWAAFEADRGMVYWCVTKAGIKRFVERRHRDDAPVWIARVCPEHPNV